MTEHDRGAYTPQPDAPLQFDARGPRMRRPMPMTLIGSGAVLVVLLGALALHYRHDTKTDQAQVPATEKVAQLKAPAAAAAPAPIAVKDTGAAVDVFGGSAHDPAAKPTLAPPPEAPKPRAQLTVQTIDTVAVKPVPTTVTTSATTTVTTKTTPAKPAVAPTVVAKAPLYKAPGVTTLAAPAKVDATSVVDKLASAPVATAVKAAPAKPTTLAATTKAPTAAPTAATAKTGATTGSAVVQIGAFSSASLSDKGWSDVSSTMGGAMGGKTKRVEVVEKDGKTFYRTSVTGFASRAAANSFCAALTAKGKTCFAKGA